MQFKKTVILFIPTLTLLLLFFTTNIYSQRDIDPKYFEQSYIDSVRTAVYDTLIELYSIEALRLDDDAEINIDGILDEKEWHLAEHKDDLLEKEPYPLVPMSDETEFAVLYDANNLYIGVWCWDSEPNKIVNLVTPRGSNVPDNLNLFLDTFHDHRTGYKFNVSPAGVQGDELRYDDIKRDRNWNGVWYSEATIDEKGWYAEIKIPFFNLRFNDLEEHIFGFNVMRNISKNGSRGQWKPHLWEWDMTTRMSTLGHITGIKNINAGRNFEIRPYILTGMEQTAPDPRSGQLNYGLDLRYSPSTSITADLTVNPDFAQIDADVVEINLTRYPTRFQELRPFFTERTNIFNTPLELFYSRRIGAMGDILGGGKMTGKLAKGFEFGAISCFTGESALSHSQIENTASEEASYAVFRVKKDVFNSSNIGILGATKEHDNEYNRVLGVDGSFVVKKNILLDIQAATGQTEQHTDNSNAYYALLTTTGDDFGMSLGYTHTDPYFEVNRIGYMRKEANRGETEYEAGFRYGPRLNREVLRRISFSTEGEISYDHFTNKYIEDWLGDNYGIDYNPEFGEIMTGEGGIPNISPGKRDFQNWRVEEELQVQLMNEMIFVAGFQQAQRSEITETYTENTWMANFTSRPVNKGARIEMILGANGGTFYNFKQKHVGSLQSVTLAGTGRLHSHILSTLEGEYTKTFNPIDNKDGEFWQFSSYTTFMLNKDFYFRLHMQGNFGTTWYGDKVTENQYLLSTLISWEYRPGSFLYLAYNEGRSDESFTGESRNFDFDDRILLLKCSYRFNL